MNTNIDPIEQLLARGVSARDLISHMLPGIVWLAEHQDEKFRICYHDDARQVVVEKVNAAKLIQRAMEIGWTLGDVRERRPASLFDEPVYAFRRGVHWYATACDDTTEMLPLGFPARELAAAQKREERLYGQAAQARRKAAEERRKRATERAEDQEVKAKVLKDVDMVTTVLMQEARAQGRPIAFGTARRKAWKRVRKTEDGVYYLFCKKLRAMKNNGVKS